MAEIVDYIFMSESTALFLKALGGILTGLLVGTGHLDATNQDQFSQNIQTIAGATVTILSTFYLLEHAFQSAKAELKWSYTPEASVNAKDPVVTIQHDTTPPATPPVTPTV